MRELNYPLLEKHQADGWARQSRLLHDALELCDWSTRKELAILLNDPGVKKSRWPKGKTYTKSVGGITFRLRSGVRQFGEKPYFHRLLVACPCCGREVPYGRMHQHAIQHVVKRWKRLTSPTDPKPSFRSIWYKRWYVDEYGFFHKMPRVIQYGFPSMPAGF